ncbi:MFS transporter [Aquiluna borgnonia]|uniref:MFS transporter n=1 Tax=Aquiluna borgnonia TaxID=2499157 RepID=A0A7D4UJS6_9MICO|nr:MFS transporter [Aquiluna borgnonia]QKJ24959.1 MFS transporter [Aquiluna borgnonia]
MAVGIRSLRAAPEAIGVLISQLFARFPFGMLSLAFVIHIQAVTGSYAIAGIALGAETIGASISGPLLARYMAVFGIRRVIGLSTLVTVSSLIALALVPPVPVLLVFIAFLVGLFSPPIQPAARSIYPQVTPKQLMPALYSLDATAQEIIWVLGPLVATLVAASFGNVAMLITVGVIQLAGTAWFLANGAVGRAKIPRTNSKLGKALRNGKVLAVTVLGLLFVGSFAGVEVGAVALFDKALAGVMFALFSLGSIFGGLFIAPRVKGKWALVVFLIISLVGYSAILFAPADPIWVGFSLFFAGLGVAPTLGLLSLMIATGTSGSETVEAYGWTTTGQLVGFSAGSALAGVAIDSVGPFAALLVSVVFGFFTIVAAVLVIRTSEQPS